jgi:hypothetical protein
MLHSLPALLNDLEQHLVKGEDPQALLASIRWPEVIDWPSNHQEAARLKAKLRTITTLINGLQAPLRATLMGLNKSGPYVARGGLALPTTLSFRLHESV